MGIPSSSRSDFLSPTLRRILLTVHIMAGVSLLGDSAGFLAISIRATFSADPQRTIELVGVLNMLSVVFGIPLSFVALLTGLSLGLGSKWGVLRYPWVTTKLLLILSVMFVGGTVIGPGESAMLAGAHDAGLRLIAAASYDVLALGVATGLSVFKPGRPFRRGRWAESAA